jgi:hypothetical protein
LTPMILSGELHLVLADEDALGVLALE